MKEKLGNKGANLHQMAQLELPVPPGFTISTEVCQHFHRNGRVHPENLANEFDRQLARLEELQEKRFGHPADPLLLSVRSGGPVSMPGMMDTILNLVHMYGDVVLGVPFEEFERRLTAARERQGVKVDSELSAEVLAGLTGEYLELIAGRGKPVPAGPARAAAGGRRRGLRELGEAARPGLSKAARPDRRLRLVYDDSSQLCRTGEVLVVMDENTELRNKRLACCSPFSGCSPVRQS